MNVELALAVLLGAVVAVGWWRGYQWSRTPLGQAQAAFERQRRERERQREALEPAPSPAQAALLGVLALAFVAWAMAPLVAELVGGGLGPWR